MRLNTIIARGAALAAIAGVAGTPVAAAAAPAPAAKRTAQGRPARVGLPPAGVTRPAVEKRLSVGEG